MKILVCGGRNYVDELLVEKTLYDLIWPDWKGAAIIQGGASGADKMAEQFCRSYGIPCIEVRANWDFYGKAAGPFRNSWMLDFCEPDLVMAFPGGRGTANMVEQATRRGIEVRQIE